MRGHRSVHILSDTVAVLAGVTWRLTVLLTRISLVTTSSCMPLSCALGRNVYSVVGLPVTGGGLFAVELEAFVYPG